MLHPGSAHANDVGLIFLDFLMMGRRTRRRDFGVLDEEVVVDGGIEVEVEDEGQGEEGVEGQAVGHDEL